MRRTSAARGRQRRRRCPGRRAPGGRGDVQRGEIVPSSSICGPSTTAKPRSAKISLTSCMTWLTGWIEPRAASTTGSDRSRGSVASRRSSASCSSGAFHRRQTRGHRLAKRVDPSGPSAGRACRRPCFRGLLSKAVTLARLPERGDAERFQARRARSRRQCRRRGWSEDRRGLTRFSLVETNARA